MPDTNTTPPIPPGTATPDGQAPAQAATATNTVEELLHEDVPLPGSVSGHRIVRLAIPAEMFTDQPPPAGLFTTLGFAKDDSQWRYDRAHALEWFLEQLRGLSYPWVQSPWKEPEPAGEEPEASPRPTPEPAADKLPPTPAGGTAQDRVRVSRR